MYTKDLTTEQKCAVLGFAVDFSGCEEPSPMQFAELQDLLTNIGEELELSHNEAENFVNKMQSNGRLDYAIKVLKTIENQNNLRLFYPYFYSVVATLRSNKGLTKLNKIYNDEFGYSKEDIDLIWELYEIKDFRNTKSVGSSSPYTTSTPSFSSISKKSGKGCLVLALAISTSLIACLCGIIAMAI